VRVHRGAVEARRERRVLPHVDAHWWRRGPKIGDKSLASQRASVWQPVRVPAEPGKCVVARWTMKVAGSKRILSHHVSPVVLPFHLNERLTFGIASVK
jgi:hypothetical protein